MKQTVVSYAIAMIGLGTASGIDILSSRRGIPLNEGQHLFAVLCGLADIVLMVAVFFLLELENAIGSLLAAWIITPVLSGVLTSRGLGSTIPGLIGIVAAIVCFAQW